VSDNSKIPVERWNNFSVRVAIIVAALFALFAANPIFVSDAVVDKLTTLFIYVTLAAMWNALAGYGGMFSAGQQAFFGLGAYLTIRLSEWGIEPYVALITSALLAGLSALPISTIVLRLRAGEFAIGMWVVAECVRLLVNLDPIIQGDTGRSLIALSLLDPAERRALTYWTALGSMGLSLGVMFILLRSQLGASIQAIRDNEEAAASVGVRVAATKRILFVIAATGCGLAGGLWLATFTTFQPRSFFSIQWSAYMIFMVLVGGIGRFEGPVLGAVIFFLIERWLGGTGVWYLIALGLVALIFALFLPKGIWGYIEDRFHILLLPVGYRLRVPIVTSDAGANSSKSSHSVEAFRGVQVQD
jgi:branched-chain amino acid transport system permease protein